MGCSSKREKQVLMILQEEPSADLELMLTMEVGVMKSLLESAGYKVITASVSGEPFKGSATTLTPDMKLTDVKLDDFAGVIVPCMATDVSVSRAPEAVKVVKEAAAQGKVIAAQMSGILVLEAAGILDGKQFSMWSDMASSVPNGIYKGENVVQDGNIITNGICPFLAKVLGKTDGTSELTQKFIDTLASKR
jgi:putative intracellular protease/amidase